MDIRGKKWYIIGLYKSVLIGCMGKWKRKWTLLFKV